MRAGGAKATKRLPDACEPDGEEWENPQRTLNIIARMLGWENTPPRRIFEQEINALKSRVRAGGVSPDLKILDESRSPDGDGHVHESLSGKTAPLVGGHDNREAGFESRPTLSNFVENKEHAATTATMQAALERIWNYFGDCQCEHDDNNCCAMLGKTEDCCPYCIAAVALGKHSIPALAAAVRAGGVSPDLKKEQS